MREEAGEQVGDAGGKERDSIGWLKNDRAGWPRKVEVKGIKKEGEKERKRKRGGQERKKDRGERDGEERAGVREAGLAIFKPVGMILQ